MDSNLNRNENKNMNAPSPQKTPKETFFHFTKQQLAVNVDKYDKILASQNSISLFNNQQLNTSTTHDKPTIFSKRLNSLDSTILEENAYKALDNNDLKLEKTIENAQLELNSIEEKLIVAETIQDEKAIKELRVQKKQLQKTLENLEADYKAQNIDTKLTSIIAQILDTPKKVKEAASKYFRAFVRRSKFIRQFTPIMRSLMVRDTLGRLDKINKSVDELVKMKVPFGEQEQRYETLINHLSRAGALHSQIMKELKG